MASAEAGPHLCQYHCGYCTVNFALFCISTTKSQLFLDLYMFLSIINMMCFIF